jgi:hypothetical protein
MSETNAKQTQNIDREVTITLKESEIFQLNLCVVARLGFVQQVWANAKTANEQETSEIQINYLSNLSGKLGNIYKEIKE